MNEVARANTTSEKPPTLDTTVSETQGLMIPVTPNYSDHHLCRPMEVLAPGADQVSACVAVHEH